MSREFESEPTIVQASMPFASAEIHVRYSNVVAKRQTNFGLIPQEAERVLMNRLGVVALPPLWARQFVASAVVYSELQRVDITDAMQRLIGSQPGSLPTLPGERSGLRALNTTVLNRLSWLCVDDSSRGLFQDPCGDYGRMVGLLQRRGNTTKRGW